MPVATDTPVETRSFHGVQLCRVGDWAASKGNGKITAEELAAMVQAAKDPNADVAMIKIGHDSANPMNAALSDGSPALGQVTKLRLSDDGQTLIGDIVGMPAKLAAAAPHAFPRRSIEMERGGGHVARLTGLALLGQTAPAVKGLDDLLALYSDAEAEVEAAVSWIEFSGDTPPVPPAKPAPHERGVVTPTASRGAIVAKLTEDPKLREAFGLAEDATDEQVNEALTKAGLAILPVTPAEPVVPAAPVEPAAPVATAASAAVTTQVDSAALSTLQAENAAMKVQLSGLVANEDKKRRDGILEQATRAGKIHPVVAGHYRAMLDTNEAETTALLSALPAVMPVVEIGHAFSAASPADDEAARIEAAKVTWIPGYKKAGA